MDESSRVDVLECSVDSESRQQQCRVIRLTNGMKAKLVHDDGVPGSPFDSTPSAFALTIADNDRLEPYDPPKLWEYLSFMIYGNSWQYTKNINGRMTIAVRSERNSFEQTFRSFANRVKNPLPRELVSETRKRLSDYVDDDAKYSVKDKLLSLLGNFGHPSRNMGRGCIKALDEKMDDDAFYQRFDDFVKRHFSADRMSLCLKTDLSLDQMQGLVVDNFSWIPRIALPEIDVSPFTHENAFQAKFHENVYFARDSSNRWHLVFTWCIPPETLESKSKPYHFLKHIIEFEEDSAGSLLYYLRRRKMWACEVSAEIKRNVTYSSFTIEVHLVQDGRKELDAVIEVVFSYIRVILQQLKHSDALQQLYRNFVNIEIGSGIFYSQDPGEIVARLAEDLMNFPPKNYPKIEYYDPMAIREAVFCSLFCFRSLQSGHLNSQIHAPREKIHLIVDDLTTILRNFQEDLTDEQFCEIIQNEWYNYCGLVRYNPSEYAIDIRKSIIHVGQWTTHEKFHALRSVSLSDMQNFRREFFKQSKVIALMQGNLSQDEAKAILHTVVSNIGCVKVEKRLETKSSTRILPRGANNISVKSIVNSRDVSTWITYHQIGEKTLRNEELLRLLWNLNSQTELQFNIDNLNVNSKLNASCLARKQQNEIVSGETFYQEVRRNWLEIVNGEYLFDRKQRVDEILATVTPSELLRFYHDNFGANERKLRIQYVGEWMHSDIISPSIEAMQAMPIEVLSAELKSPEPIGRIRTFEEFIQETFG